LCEARGYDLEHLEGTLTRRLRWAQENLPPIVNLAITVAIEHFTALFAQLMLRPGSIIDKAEPSMRELWRSHAAEEMEHKSVAFDVYRAVGGTEAMRKSFMRRVSRSTDERGTFQSVVLHAKKGRPIVQLQTLAMRTHRPIWKNGRL
jgi:predicted metal-dependent hydrolase